MLNYIWDFFSFLKNVYYYLSQKDRLEKYGFKFAVKNITDRQGRQFGWVGADDGTYGVFKEIADKQVGNPLKGLCDVKELELRDDDVMVCTYPRTGVSFISYV